MLNLFCNERLSNSDDKLVMLSVNNLLLQSIINFFWLKKSQPRIEFSISVIINLCSNDLRSFGIDMFNNVDPNTLMLAPVAVDNFIGV